MPEEFPKIDIDEFEDLEYAVEVIREHSMSIVKRQIRREGRDSDSDVVALCEKVVNQWTKNMRQRLEPNILVNGLSFRESTKEVVEPFDQELSLKIQRLSEQVDNLTEEAINARKSIPARRAQLMKARSEALSALREPIEQERRAVEERYESDIRASEREKLHVERSGEIQQTLHTAVEDVEKLAVSVLEHSTAAQQQANLIKRLRTMPS